LKTLLITKEKRNNGFGDGASADIYLLYDNNIPDAV
jgi:hypothetical protein